MSKYYQHLITPVTAVIVFDDGRTISILDDDPRYNRICYLLREGLIDEAVKLTDKATLISKETKGKFNVVDGVVVIDGEELPDALSNKLIQFVDNGANTQPLENFWNNLQNNPVESSRQDLFAFIEANDIPLTKDGCFVVYKKVKEDWMDSYTGKTHDNSPGNIVVMKREKVDQDRTHTCSAGLHVAAYEYAKGFSGQRLLEVKVNPQDVVAVPPDYNQQKMRVCRYEVLRETNEKYSSELEYVEDHELGRLDDAPEYEMLLPDKEGRLRIPGTLIRKLGVGVGAYVEANVLFKDDGIVELQVQSDNTDYFDWTVYTVREDNSVRISQSILRSAGIAGNPAYYVGLGDEGSLVVRADSPADHGIII